MTYKQKKNLGRLLGLKRQYAIPSVLRCKDTTIILN
nr:MAG TPA: hypothetical protein [Caudoviricetes sp.]